MPMCFVSKKRTCMSNYVTRYIHSDITLSFFVEHVGEKMDVLHFSNLPNWNSSKRHCCVLMTFVPKNCDKTTWHYFYNSSVKMESHCTLGTHICIMRTRKSSDNKLLTLCVKRKSCPIQM